MLCSCMNLYMLVYVTSCVFGKCFSGEMILLQSVEKLYLLTYSILFKSFSLYSWYNSYGFLLVGQCIALFFTQSTRWVWVEMWVLCLTVI